MLAIPIDEAIIPRERAGRVGRRPRADPRGRPRRRLSGRRRVPRDAARRVPPRQPRGAGDLVGAQRRRHLPDGHPQLDDARDGSRARSTRSASRSSQTIDDERREIARAAGFGDDTAAYRASLDAERRQHAGDQGRARRARDARTSSARWPPRRSTSARCRRPAATSARSRSTRRRTRPFAYYYPPAADGSRDGIYYANGYDLAVAQVHEARLDDVPRGGAGAPLPDRARDGEPAT